MPITTIVIGTDQYAPTPRAEIFAGDIILQIHDLASDLKVAEEHGVEPAEEDQAEYAQLCAFRDEATRVTGKQFRNVTIVLEDLFADFLRELAEENGEISEELSSFVDWPAYARSARADFIQLAFGDDRVLVH